MRTSEKITELIVALLVVQEHIKNPTKNKTNPHFKSRYANLEQVLAVSLPILNANHIFLTQTHVYIEGHPFLQTTLLHSGSGQFIQSEIPLIMPKQDMQSFGAATSYARRYAITSMLGIEQEDDDGNSIKQQIRSNEKYEDNFSDPRDMPKINRDAKPPSKTVNEAIGKLKEEILKPGHLHEWRDDKFKAGQQYCACPLPNGAKCTEKRRNPSV